MVLQIDEPVAISQLVSELKLAGVVIVEDERLSSPCEGTRVTVRHEPSNQIGVGLACDDFFH